MGKELKDRKIWLHTGLLILVQMCYVMIGHGLFGHAYLDYDIGRALDVSDSGSIRNLLLILPVSGLGEEIAWRGFFLGKRNQKIPFPVWTVFSSVLFAMWHFSQHAIPIVLFGISTNFVCSLIFCSLFQRTGNSMISTIAHVIGNYAEVFLILLAF